MGLLTESQFAKQQHERFQNNLTAALKTLLEQKHLYQAITIPRTDGYVVRKPDDSTVPETIPSVRDAIDGWWALDIAVRPGANPIFVQVPDIKVFCERCSRLEAYNPVLAKDVLKDVGNLASPRGETEQAFLLAYQCQSCKRTPELFLVHRAGRAGVKLRNVGRSPIEHVDVPLFVPKSVQRFLSGAIVAYQSGQALAGVFMLRTLIEQWARLASGSKKEQADQVMDDYMATLPEDFRGRFPSMRALYSELSADIHGAKGSPKLFDRARTEIVQHFDARRMFGLPSDVAVTLPAAEKAQP
jgi:hypothetical protein